MILPFQNGTATPLPYRRFRCPWTPPESYTPHSACDSNKSWSPCFRSTCWSLRSSSACHPCPPRPAECRDALALVFVWAIAVCTRRIWSGRICKRSPSHCRWNCPACSGNKHSFLAPEIAFHFGLKKVWFQGIISLQFLDRKVS